MHCPVAAQNGIAYFASGTGVYAVNVKTGDLQWQYPVPEYLSDSTGAVSVGNGYVFASMGSNLYCIDAADGQMMWSTQTSGVPSVTNNLVIADGTAYNLSSGEKVWSLDIDNLSVPAISGNAVYYGHYFNEYGDYFKHELFGVNATTGKIFWTYKLEQINHSQKAGVLAVTSQNLYVSDTGLFQLFPTVSYPNVLAFNLAAISTRETTPTSEVNTLYIGLICLASFIAAIAVVARYAKKRKKLGENEPIKCC
jgi:outer membrane protein assembly factor BamB